MLLETILKQPANKVDTVTIIKTDTVRLASDASFELIAQIDNFYNNSWNKLAIALTLIGVLVPAAFSWYQKRQLKLETEHLKRDFENKSKNQLDLLKKNLIAHNAKNLKELENKLERSNSIKLEIIEKKLAIQSEYTIAHLQSLTFYATKQYSVAALNSIIALLNLLQLENDNLNIRDVFANLISALNLATVKDFEQNKVEFKSQLDALNGNREAYTIFKTEIDQINIFYNQLTKEEKEIIS